MDNTQTTVNPMKDTFTPYLAERFFLNRQTTPLHNQYTIIIENEVLMLEYNVDDYELVCFRACITQWRLLSNCQWKKNLNGKASRNIKEESTDHWQGNDPSLYET